MLRTFRSVQREFILSFLVHILVLGAAIVFGSQAGRKNVESVVVFLNEEMPGGNSGNGIKEIGFQVKKGSGKREVKKKRSEPRNIPEKTVSIEKPLKPEYTDTPVDLSSVATANTSTISAASDGFQQEQAWQAAGPEDLVAVASGRWVAAAAEEVVGAQAPDTAQAPEIAMFFPNNTSRNITHISGSLS
jgi:hypothetical protein